MISGVQPFGWLLLGLLALGAALDCALELLNFRHFKRRASIVPASLAGHLSSWTLERSLAYAAAKARLSAFGELFSFCFWPLLLFSGLFGEAVSALERLHAGLLVSGLLLLGAFGLARGLYEAPLELYSTFVVERRFGFHSGGLSLWFRDQLVKLLVSGSLFGLLCSAALLLIDALPSFWWLPLWLLLLGATLLGSWAYPVLIAPLFNKFEPLEDEALSAAVSGVLRKAGLEVSAVMKMDASKRTRHGNAFFAGLGPGRRIVFYDNLLSSLSRDELVAVAAHEAGHWKLGHIPKMLSFSNALFLFSLLGAWALVEKGLLLDAFGIHCDSRSLAIAASLCLASLAFDALVWPLAPLVFLLARRFERQADAFAARLCGGLSLASALAKLSRDNLSNIHPHPWYVAFKVSHPPVPERVRDLEAFQANSADGLR